MLLFRFLELGRFGGAICRRSKYQVKGDEEGRGEAGVRYSGHFPINQSSQLSRRVGGETCQSHVIFTSLTAVARQGFSARLETA